MLPPSISISVRRALCALLVAVAMSLAPSGSVGAQPASPALPTAPSGPYAAAIDSTEALLDSLMTAQGIPGVTAAVGVDGRIVWSEGFGHADVETRTPVWPHTKMRVGSVSKALTSVAVGQLVEAGSLDLDAPVQRYVPSFPTKRDTVTTRLAAGHLAGIRHYRNEEFLSKRHYNSVDAGLEIFEADTLLFEPGTDYSYSSYGWNLVSAVVEGAADQPFLAYMREHVIRPLNLRHTVADHVDSLIANRGAYYVREDGALRNAPYVDNSYKWAGGGYLSTAEDLVRFGQGVHAGTVLDPDTAALLMTSQRTSDGETTGYGIGWQIDTGPDGRRIVGHGGGSVGGSTAFITIPSANVVVAIISNMSGVDYGDVPVRVGHHFIDAPSQ
jgi:CubicO group peptidase (beta-lactamase class C family)